MAKIYLSAMFERRDEMQALASHMEWDGHEVVSRWHRGQQPAAHDAQYQPEDWRIWVGNDFEDIDRCEFFIAQMEPRDTMSRGCRHVKWGYAIARSKICFAVGSEYESQFYSVADALFPTVAKAAGSTWDWPRPEALVNVNIDETRIAQMLALPPSMLARRVGRERPGHSMLRTFPTNVIQDQPAPTTNNRPAVWPLVIEDMRGRDVIGRERYGTPLQPHNGRDALVDAYQEGLDLVVCLRQAIEERNV